MARSRNIKPGFFTNDVLGELPPLTRLLFAGMWTICDREGRLEDRPKKIRAEVLPYDDCDPEAMLQDLEKHGFILRYESGGVRAIQVLTWEKHQNPHVKEAASTIPAPCLHGASTGQAPDKQEPRADEAQDKEQPLPERAGLIPDSSPLIPDSKGDTAPRKRSAAPELPCPPDVDPQTWADWLKLRKAKKAPVTETVTSGARDEAKKAGMALDAFLQVWCLRGSQGLQADWLKPNERQTQSRVTFAQQDELARRARWEQMTGRKWPEDGPTPDFIDVETLEVGYVPADQSH